MQFGPGLIPVIISVLKTKLHPSCWPTPQAAWKIMPLLLLYCLILKFFEPKVHSRTYFPESMRGASFRSIIWKQLFQCLFEGCPHTSPFHNVAHGGYVLLDLVWSAPMWDCICHVLQRHSGKWIELPCQAFLACFVLVNTKCEALYKVAYHFLWQNRCIGNFFCAGLSCTT